jgi:hypothetical protein
MSGGAISLEKSVRTCDVNVGEASRIQSDRFFNPNNMVCIPWNGLDNEGREVCPDSFYTKTPGCDSAEDRVMVENALRPKYMNYVTLGAQGISGHIYGNESAARDAYGRQQFDQSRNQISGNFGLQWGANVAYQSCSVGAYERGMAQLNQQLRQQNFMQNGGLANMYQRAAGNRMAPMV